jgi:hypothetical protein
MAYQRMSFSILVILAALALPGKKADATAVDRTCAITASGDVCIFTIKTNASGNLTVSTRACVNGQRWRTIIAKFNTGQTVSQVGAGSTVAFTGRAVRSTSKGANFLVIVTLEWPVLDPFSGASVVRFVGPFTSVTGPRPHDAGELPVSFDCSIVPQLPTVGDRSNFRSMPVFALPIQPSLPTTNTLLPPTNFLLPPTTNFESGISGF